MASPAEIEKNLPDTLPADFGEWDSSDSPAAPAETPARKPPEKTPRESAQIESARREAEALDFGAKPFVAREVSSEVEPPRNVTPFPEPEEVPVPPRGIPAPVVRAPRKSPAPSLVPPPPIIEDDSALLRRLRNLDTVVEKPLEKPPVVETRKADPVVATVSLLERKPDKPLFSSVEESATSETALSDQFENEEEQKTRRKWIISGCVFGGALLLVVAQLIHYNTGRKIKHNAPSVATTQYDSGVDSDTTIADVNPVETKPSPAKQSLESVPVQVANTTEMAPEKAPAVVQTQMMKTQLMAPTRLPQNAKTVAPNDVPPPSSLGNASIAALNGNNTMGNVFAGQPNVQVSGPKVITVSAGVATGMLIRHQQPVYPPIAKSARVQGTVVLNAVISRTGQVTNVQLVSGPPMLRQSAIDAVKTWQYKPYTLNGQPTEINTTVNVVFSLGG